MVDGMMSGELSEECDIFLTNVDRSFSQHATVALRADVERLVYRVSSPLV